MNLKWKWIMFGCWHALIVLHSYWWDLQLLFRKCCVKIFPLGLDCKISGNNWSRILKKHAYFEIRMYFICTTFHLNEENYMFLHIFPTDHIFLLVFFSDFAINEKLLTQCNLQKGMCYELRILTTNNNRKIDLSKIPGS